MTTGFSKPVRNILMNRILEKSLMPPTLRSYSSRGMRNRYQVQWPVLPLRSGAAVSRLSTI